eukprot:6473194-Amphidinium_carterae.2
MEQAMWGLLWRIAKRIIWTQAGHGWDSFVKSDSFGPLATPPIAQLLQQPLATPIAQVAPKKMKASALIDQTDESEIPIVDVDVVATWVVLLKQPPYVDFGIFGPFARKSLRTQRFRPLPDGKFQVRINRDWHTVWHLIAISNDKARGYQHGKVYRNPGWHFCPRTLEIPFPISTLSLDPSVSAKWYQIRASGILRSGILAASSCLMSTVMFHWASFLIPVLSLSYATEILRNPKPHTIRKC